MPNSKEFLYLIKYVIEPVHQTVLSECDQAFLSITGLYYRDKKERFDQIESAFHQQRQQFKRQCYGDRQERSGRQLLDSRKVAAVMCKTFLDLKPFYFDVEAADQYVTDQKNRLTSEEYTKWAVSNTLINYKFAHLVGTQLVYISLLSELLKNDSTVEMGEKLNEVGHLFHYQTESCYDTLDTNIIVGMARADVNRQEMNMMFYAMLLYQVEMFTRERLKGLVNGKKDSFSI